MAESRETLMAFESMVDRALKEPGYQARLCGSNREDRMKALQEALGGKPPSEQAMAQLDKAIAEMAAMRRYFDDRPFAG